MAHIKKHIALTKRAVKLAGGQHQLAAAMSEYQPKVRQGHVSHWIAGRRNVSPKMAVAMEKAVACGVTRSEFYPDLFEAAA